MRYLLLLSYKFLFKRKGSVFAASGAVAATIFLIIFSTVVVGGVVNGLVRDLGDMNPGHISISNDKGLLTRPANQVLSHVLKNPDVEGAAPRIYAGYILEINHTIGGKAYSKHGVQGIGVDPLRELTASRLQYSVVEGTFPPRKGAVVLETELAEAINAKIGSYIKVKAHGSVRTLAVVGLFHVAGPTFFGDNMIMHQNDLKEMLGIEKRYTQAIMVRLKDPEQKASVKNWIENSYITDKFQRVETAEESGEGVITAYREGIAFVNILMYSGMVASGLGVITILMMMVNSKIREIGILRAIGMTGGRILLIFIINGAILGALGAAFGAIGGSVLSLYLADNPVALFSGLVPDIKYTPAVLPGPMLVGFTISVIASVYPALRASRFQPEEAMRYV